jgi:hypothetical protein
VSTFLLSEKFPKNELFKALKCARCGSIENIQSFESKFKQVTNIKRTRHYTRYNTLTYTNEVPVCKICNKKFENFKNIRSLIKAGFFILSVALSISLFIILFDGVTGAFEEGLRQLALNFISLPIKLIPLIILFIFLGIVSSLHKSKTKNNPSKYIKNLYGMISISPENSDEWYPYMQWVVMVLKERILHGDIDPTILYKLNQNSDVQNEMIIRQHNNASLSSRIERENQSIPPQKICPKCGNIVLEEREQSCTVCGFKFD